MSDHARKELLMAHEVPPSVSGGTPTVDLEPIKAREAAATEGPWEVWNCEDISIQSVDGLSVVDVVGPEDEQPQVGDDARFIAHARTDIPQLIAEVERLRAALSALSGQTAPQKAKERCPYCAIPDCVCDHKWGDSCRCGAGVPKGSPIMAPEEQTLHEFWCPHHGTYTRRDERHCSVMAARCPTCAVEDNKYNTANTGGRLGPMSMSPAYRCVCRNTNKRIATTGYFA